MAHLLLPICEPANRRATSMPYRRTENVTRRLAARRDAIIAAARILASESGMAAVQIATVAARAGIATGTVYRYFPAKTELVAAVLTEIAEREISALQQAAAAAPGPLSALAAAIMTFAARALRDRRLLFAAIAEPIDADLDARPCGLSQSAGGGIYGADRGDVGGASLTRARCRVGRSSAYRPSRRRFDRFACARSVRPRARDRAVAHACCLARARRRRRACARPCRADGDAGCFRGILARRFPGAPHRETVLL